jgi:hypothetical protein
MRMLGKIMSRAVCSGRFMMYMAVLFFLSSWTLFLVGGGWSWAYYHTHFAPQHELPPLDGNQTHPPTTPPVTVRLSNGQRHNQHHFPLQVGQWVPSLASLFAYFLMLFYEYGEPGPKIKDPTLYNCCKDFLMITSWIAAGAAIVGAFVYLLFLFTLGDPWDGIYVAVVDFCMLGQTIGLAMGLGIAYISKWLYYREASRRRPVRTEDGDDAEDDIDGKLS